MDWGEWHATQIIPFRNKHLARLGSMVPGQGAGVGVVLPTGVTAGVTYTSSYSNTWSLQAPGDCLIIKK